MDTHQFTAVIGGGARIMSIEAEHEDAARQEISRQLLKNPQRREIWQQWQATGAAIVSEELEEEWDEAQANALIRGRLAELLAELEEYDKAFGRGRVALKTGPVADAMDRARAALKAFDRAALHEYEERSA